MGDGGWRVEGGGWGGGGWRVEGGGWRVEVGGWRLEGLGWRAEGGGWREREDRTAWDGRHGVLCIPQGQRGDGCRPTGADVHASGLRAQRSGLGVQVPGFGFRGYSDPSCSALVYPSLYC